MVPSGIAGWATSHSGAIKEPSTIPASFAGYWRSEKAGDIGVWTAPPAADHAILVMVHGYRQPRSGLQQLAEHLHERGYGIVLVDLPYADGSEPHSGGSREAAAVQTVVEWTKDRFEKPVVLMGYSAGGFASALAVRNGADVAALLTDSAFVDAEETFRDVAARRTRLPKFAFFALRPAFYLSSKGGRLQRVPDDNELSKTPTLVTHGSDDDFIPPSNAQRLGRLFDARLWIVDGADHGGAWYADASAYEDLVDSFVTDATSRV